MGSSDDVFYCYEALIIPEEDECYTITIPSVPSLVSWGRGLAQACENAAGDLQMLLADYRLRGEDIPESYIGDNPKLILSGTLPKDYRFADGEMTVTEAANYLEVSRGRISQLLNQGLLDSVEVHGRRLVTVESLNRRKEEMPKSGRPRKESR